ncbi:8374_t:CDS:2 [Funneliformis caledonium]|uniref:8374_t:CDS:1 n=1 Tax=Funneliformis caledonium TaxID=1117310 RepID=A0A9N8VDX0_9GLOM|nr:8374_t:CDS:2 [Funneliformis caledonium]
MHPGIFNFKEKLGLEKWVGNSAHGKLSRWIQDLHLFQGLAINKSYEIESSKKFAIKFIEVPTINLRDESYFELINPTTRLEEILISNNIFSIKNVRNFPFIKNDDISDKDYIHLIIKYEQYEIFISRDQIKPLEEFIDAIENALKSMKPFNALQDVFNVYGHLFPLRIILGKSLKNILTTQLFGTFEKINSKLPMSSLKSYLNNLNITYLTTQKGDVIEDNDRLRIIMTGINDLKDLNIDNIEHYKRINIESSLEDENYQVFGSIITKDNIKSLDFVARFRLFYVNGFSAMIKPLRRSAADIRTCYILWKSFEIVGDTILIDAYYPSTNYEPHRIIKLVEWEDEVIHVQLINESSSDSSEVKHVGNIDSLTSANINLRV